MTGLDLSSADADGLLRMVLLGLREHVRNGGAVPSWATRRCQELAALAGDPALSAVSARGHAPGTVVSTTDGLVAVPEAAALVGRSERHVRRLASAGRVRGVKDGRDWHVDVDSLRSVLSRAS